MRFMNITIFSATFLTGCLWLVSLFSWYPDPLHAKHIYLALECKTELQAENLARKDFSKELYVLFLNAGDRRARLIELRDSLLLNNYNIRVVHLGCVSDDNVDQYTLTMVKLLHQRYNDELIRVIEMKSKEFGSKKLTE
jgi:hypothetical protein